MNAPLRIHNLTVTHRGHPAVHHLSGEFAPGLLTAVVGPNGAGKSSLMSVLAGTRRDFEGRLDRPPAQQVAYLPQAASLDRSVPVTVHEVVAMGLWPRLGSFRGLDSDGRAAVSHALAAVGLSGLERRLIGELSAGQTQRVLFARVLVQDAQLILLDEPFNAIDARTTADLLGGAASWALSAAASCCTCWICLATAPEKLPLARSSKPSWISRWAAPSVSRAFSGRTSRNSCV